MREQVGMKFARNIINQNQADKPETIQVVNKGRSKDKTQEWTNTRTHNRWGVFNERVSHQLTHRSLNKRERERGGGLQQKAGGCKIYLITLQNERLRK